MKIRYIPSNVRGHVGDTNASLIEPIYSFTDINTIDTYLVSRSDAIMKDNFRYYTPTRTISRYFSNKKLSYQM